jgi:hypothetical protein
MSTFLLLHPSGLLPFLLLLLVKALKKVSSLIRRRINGKRLEEEPERGQAFNYIRCWIQATNYR